MFMCCYACIFMVKVFFNEVTIVVYVIMMFLLYYDVYVLVEI